VYVGDLDPNVTEAMLYDHFKTCGPVVSVRVCLDSQTHKSLGYGYVNFQNPADAEVAIDKMNATKLASKFIRVAKIQRDPSARKAGVNNIIVKRLPVDIDTPALKEIFNSFGKIVSLRIATDENGKSRGYAYLQFESEEACNKAVAEVDGTEVEGQSISVERYNIQHRAQQLEKFTNLYVKNLKDDVSEEQLKDAFAPFGNITSLKIRMGTEGESAGFGFVAYATHEEAQNAVDGMNEKQSNLAKDETVLYVARFESKRERQRKREISYRERQAQYAKFPNLYVKNFDDTVTMEQLKEVFERFGPTQSVKVQIDPTTRLSRGFGFVSYKDMTSAQKALAELPGSNLLGPRPLFVAFALKKDARRAQYEEMQKKRINRAMGNMYNQPGMGGGNQFGGQPGMGGGPGMFGGQGHNNMMMRMQMQQQHPMQQRNPMMMPGGMQPNPMMMQQQRMRPMPKPGVMPGGIQQQQPQQQYPSPAGAPQMQQPQAPAQQAPQQQSLSSILASMSVEQQKNVLGERLYTYISKKNPQEAAKVTGMLLEMDNAEILNLLDSPDLLDGKIQEALEVLSRHNTGGM
jgi:polyadenylate-binding protein